MFVRCGGTHKVSDFIEKVVYYIHEDFKPNTLHIKQAPFELTRVGWGYFDVEIEVHFKKWTKLEMRELEHELSFDGNGSYKTFSISIDQDILT
jgi:transcription initiation factor IIF auxiliary subunit